MAFTETFGGTTIYPSDVSYRAISLSADQTLSWPLETATNGNVVAQIMDVTPSAGGFKIIMPAANEASPGETALFFNAGSYNFTVADSLGSTIVTITPGLAYQVYLTTNATAAGTWRTTQFGAGTSSATAGSLVGYGIKAINTTLNQSMAVTSLSVNYTAGAADRSSAFLWTGGAGTITLPAASTVGNDWFFHIRNGGTGAIAVTPTGGEFINGSASVAFNPGDSAIIVCDGSGYFTIGFGQAPEFLFDYVSIDLTGQSSPYTLAGSNLNRIAYQFSGTLTTNMEVIVPATIQQYWVGNFTTGGSYTLTVKTSGGTGVTVVRDGRSILYCNGTDVVTADTGGISIPILVSQGGTGATNASSARTNLGATSVGNAVFIAVDEAAARNAIIAAKSGANSDITSLSGLTTPLSVAQGGTGAATLTSNGLVYGSGTSAVGVTAAGTTGQVLVGNTGSAPSWAALTGIGVTSFSAGSTGLTPSTGTTGAITLAGTLNVANGGTGASTLTANYLVKGNGTSAVSASVVYDDGTNVGIGTSSPTNGRFNVQAGTSATGNSAFFNNVDGTYNPYLQIQHSSAGVKLFNSSSFGGTSNNLIFGNGSTSETMRIDSSGNVLVGTTTAGSAGFTVNQSSNISFNEASGQSLATIFRQSSSGDTVIGSGVARSSTANGFASSYSSAWARSSVNVGYGAIKFFTAPVATVAVGTDVTMNECMRIDSSGNVGIGTSSPARTLSVYSASSIPAQIESSGTDARISIFTSSGSSGQGFVQASSGSLLLGSSNTERMRIDSSGNVTLGIGGGAKTVLYNDQSIASINTAGSAYTDLKVDGLNLLFRTGSGSTSERMRIDSSGNVGIGTSSPGYKLDVVGGIRAVLSGQTQLWNGSTGVYTSWQYNGTTVGDIGTGNQAISGGSTGDFGITSRSGNLLLGTGSIERARIDSTGLFQINTTSTPGTGSPKLVVDGGISGKGTVTINNSTATTIAQGAGLLILVRDTTNGGTAVVCYENAQTPVIISNAGGGTTFQTTTPSGSGQIQLSNRSGNLGIAALASTDRNNAVLSVTIIQTF